MSSTLLTVIFTLCYIFKCVYFTNPDVSCQDEVLINSQQNLISTVDRNGLSSWWIPSTEILIYQFLFSIYHFFFWKNKFYIFAWFSNKYKLDTRSHKKKKMNNNKTFQLFSCRKNWRILSFFIVQCYNSFLNEAYTKLFY